MSALGLAGGLVVGLQDLITSSQDVGTTGLGVEEVVLGPEVVLSMVSPSVLVLMGNVVSSEVVVGLAVVCLFILKRSVVLTVVLYALVMGIRGK